MQRSALTDYRDTAIGVGLLAFSGLYWLGAKAIRVSPLEGSVGSAGLPKALAVALAILSLYLIARNLLTVYGRRRPRGSSAVKASAPAAEAASGDDMPLSFREHLRALWMLGFGVVYLLLLPELGYAVSVAILMAAVSYYLGLRGLPKVALFAISGGAFFFLLFVVILKIPLPEGIFSDMLRR